MGKTVCISAQRKKKRERWGGKSTTIITNIECPAHPLLDFVLSASMVLRV